MTLAQTLRARRRFAAERSAESNKKTTNSNAKTSHLKEWLTSSTTQSLNLADSQTYTTKRPRHSDDGLKPWRRPAEETGTTQTHLYTRETDDSRPSNPSQYGTSEFNGDIHPTGSADNLTENHPDRGRPTGPHIEIKTTRTPNRTYPGGPGEDGGTGDTDHPTRGTPIPDSDARKPPAEDKNMNYQTRSQKQLYKTICSKCGQECEVPFEPTFGRRTYCETCFKEVRNRPLYDTTCTVCGTPFTLPFPADQNRPYYCEQCYKKEKERRTQRTLYKGTCSSCGGEALVPFRPDPNRRLLCSDCFKKEREKNN